MSLQTLNSTKINQIILDIKIKGEKEQTKIEANWNLYQDDKTPIRS